MTHPQYPTNTQHPRQRPVQPRPSCGSPQQRPVGPPPARGCPKAAPYAFLGGFKPQRQQMYAPPPPAPQGDVLRDCACCKPVPQGAGCCQPRSESECGQQPCAGCCCCPGKNDNSVNNFNLPQVGYCCPESGCCTCADWCCPWVNHTKISKYVGRDEDSRWCISVCLSCMPCATFSCCSIVCGCACGPDCHGLYHGSTASISLREHAGLEARQCDLICFSTFCPSCALTHDKNIMDALIRAGVPPKNSHRQLTIVDHVDFQDLVGDAKAANPRQGPSRVQMQ